MKKLTIPVVIIALLFSAIIAALNLIYNDLCIRQNEVYNISAGRITAELTEAYMNGRDLSEYAAENYDKWLETYNENCPSEIEIIPVNQKHNDVFVLPDISENIICGILNDENCIEYLVCHRFNDKNNRFIITAANIVLIAAFLISEFLLVFVYVRILSPFSRFSEYPERLAKMQSAEKLPESRNKYFGKYIWGMNLLADKLETDRRQIHSIEYQRQTLIASIAHGVKTPVANIRLYSSAICEGLYSDGIVNETDAMIAEKIESNAIKIEKLTKELLDTASSALVSYEPHTGFFYIKELIDSVKTEWTHRLSIKRIPFTAECIGNPIMESDKTALVSVISQLIENAVKYSNGTGISVTVLKDDENFIISVKSKGGLLPEKELPYIFRSFWRGSNAENTEGSGIGLFTASEIIKKLGGNIYAKCLTESDEMEFVIFL